MTEFVSLDDLSVYYKNVGTSKNAKTLINRANLAINKPKGYLYSPDDYVNGFSDIVTYFYVNGKNQNITRLRSEMSTIGKAIKLITGDDRFSKLVPEVNHLDIRNKPTKCDCPKWEDIENYCKNIIETSSDVYRKTLATCYLNGYPLRVGEIFTTRLSDDGENNYLDLDNKTWTIRRHKNVLRTGERKFNVSQEFVDQIRKLYPPTHKEWLFQKRSGKPYSIRSASHQTFNFDISNTDIRNSFETYVNKDPEVSKNILGHNVETADEFYRPHVEANKINKKIKVIVKPRNST